jgi:hypothetical protein
MVWLRDRDAQAWQRGELDDAAFERRQVRWAWKVAALLFGALAVGGSVVALVNDAPWSQVALLVGVLVVFGFAAAVRMGRWARFGARNQIIKRRRDQVEANPAMPLAIAPATPVELQRFFGAHRRSVRYANWVLKMTALIAAIDAALWWGYGPGVYQIVFACAAVVFFGWSMFVPLSRPTSHEVHLARTRESSLFRAGWRVLATHRTSHDPSRRQSRRRSTTQLFHTHLRLPERSVLR